jgi:hypothetical protein
MSEHYQGEDLSVACLYWAYVTTGYLRRFHIPAVIQAGSASWPRMRPEQSRGRIHFGYHWNPNSPETKIALIKGALPEMHVWAAIPATREIVDLTTAFWPEKSVRLYGLPWTAERPPDYFWSNELPDGVIYEPEIGAIYVASMLLRATAPNVLALNGTRFDVALPGMRV